MINYYSICITISIDNIDIIIANAINTGIITIHMDAAVCIITSIAINTRPLIIITIHIDSIITTTENY